jgi:hypothetical protein
MFNCIASLLVSYKPDLMNCIYQRLIKQKGKVVADVIISKGNVINLAAITLANVTFLKTTL